MKGLLIVLLFIAGLFVIGGLISTITQFVLENWWLCIIVAGLSLLLFSVVAEDEKHQI
jgi:hypothetical protein